MLDFTELSDDGNDLELLIREILAIRGFEVHWSGKGQDGGRDLICIERRGSFFRSDEKRWLIQCKHNAKAERSVGVNDLGDIIDACAQHECRGILLACTTYPSSSVVERLEAITQNAAHDIEATYWDMVKIENILTTPKNWPIAQRFFPVSAMAENWRIYATESPNNWVINFRGYYFHLNNRVGSTADNQLETVRQRIKDMEAIEFQKGHCLRMRSIYRDDKNGTYKWYLDHMYPFDEEATLSSAQIAKLLGDGYVLEDDQIHYFDVINRSYNPNSDHHDLDHYDYYSPESSSFIYGADRHLDAKAAEESVSGKLKLDKQLELERSGDFENLCSKFSELSFVKLVNSRNAGIEYLDRFYKQFYWSSIIEEVGLQTDRFFSAWFMFDVEDGERFHHLVSYFPQRTEHSFRLTRACIYLPNERFSGSRRVDEEDEWLYELTLSIHPYIVGNKTTGRNLLNEYFRTIVASVDDFIKNDGSRS